MLIFAKLKEIINNCFSFYQKKEQKEEVISLINNNTTPIQDVVIHNNRVPTQNIDINTLIKETNLNTILQKPQREPYPEFPLNSSISSSSEGSFEGFWGPMEDLDLDICTEAQVAIENLDGELLLTTLSSLV